MNKVEYLLEQAARAERLARSILDTVTVERLQAFAAECRDAPGSCADSGASSCP